MTLTSKALQVIIHEQLNMADYCGFIFTDLFPRTNYICDRIERETQLADSWDWNEMFWNWLLDSNFNCMQIESINDFPVEQSSRQYMY